MPRKKEETGVAAQKPDDKWLDSKPGKIDFNKALKLRFEKNLSLQDIAEHFGVSRQAVWERFQRFKELLEDPESVTAHQSNRDRFWSTLEMKYLLNALDPEKVKETSAAQSAMIAGIAYDKTRLERGLSTENISIKNTAASINQAILDINKRIEELS